MHYDSLRKLPCSTSANPSQVLDSGLFAGAENLQIATGPGVLQLHLNIHHVNILCREGPPRPQVEAAPIHSASTLPSGHTCYRCPSHNACSIYTQLEP